MMAAIEKGLNPDAAAAVQAGIADAIPMKRCGTTAEMAGVMAFLASDDAAYVNGTAMLSTAA